MYLDQTEVKYGISDILELISNVLWSFTRIRQWWRRIRRCN